MNRRHHEDGDQAARLVSRVWRSIEPLDPDTLREFARRAAMEDQRAEPPRPRARSRLRARWAVAAAASAVLVGSGLGFGLGSSLTPSGSAGRNVIGFGFLPDRGWTVVQAGGPHSDGSTTAVASNVPLRSGSAAGAVSSSVDALPVHGILLAVTSTPRGDPAEDVAFPIRDLPLQVTDARASRSSNRASLRLLAGLGGYNVEARLYFGTARPKATMLAAAQHQLNRLVVAADRVTIAVRPTVSSPLTGMVTVFGTIDSGKAGESVTVQAKDCGATFFRVYAGASTEPGGSWSTVIFPRISTTLRAVWNNETSAQVNFRQRAFVGFVQRSSTRFRVSLVGYGTRFIGKYVNVRRFDQRLGQWETIRRVVLTSADRFGTYITLPVPKGTRLRAVLPNSQARPCYLGATSRVIRT